MEAEKILELEDERLKEDTVTVTAQDEELAQLRAAIAAEQDIVDDLTEKLDEQNKIKTKEDLRNRDLQRENTALTAKKKFIEVEYDYTGSVDGVGKNLKLFEEIIKSNQNVNNTVTNFMKRVEVTHKEVEAIIDEKSRMGGF